jgi:hypothetical protein
MRRPLVWLGGALGGAAFVRLLSRRARTAPSVAPAPAPAAEPADPRADELRRRLEESRAIVGEREGFEEAETPVDEAEPAAVDERRARVHEEGRRAAERMRGPSSG